MVTPGDGSGDKSNCVVSDDYSTLVYYLDSGTDQKIKLLAQEGAKLTGNKETDVTNEIKNLLGKVENNQQQYVLDRLFLKIEACLSVDNSNSEIKEAIKKNINHLSDLSIPKNTNLVDQALCSYSMRFENFDVSKLPAGVRDVLTASMSRAATANFVIGNIITNNQDNKDLLKLIASNLDKKTFANCIWLCYSIRVCGWSAGRRKCPLPRTPLIRRK